MPTGKAGKVLNKTVAIVVTYNRCELLQECINALRNSVIAVDVLVVDNASTDGTEEMLKAYPADSGVRYHRMEKNTGGAGGFSFGLKKAYGEGYDYFWLMDDDTMIYPDSLEKLMEAGKKLEDGYGFLSGLALWTDGTECTMNYHAIAADWNMEKKKLEEGILKVEAATFVSFFTRREVIASVGLPIKEYFIWGDDTEFTRRISRCYPCYLAVHSRVIHKMASNQASGDIADNIDTGRIDRMFYSVRNDCCTHRRMGWKNFLRYTINTIHMLVHVLMRARQFKGRKVKVIIKGYFAGVMFRPGIEMVR